MKLENSLREKILQIHKLYDAMKGLDEVEDLEIIVALEKRVVPLQAELRGELQEASAHAEELGLPAADILTKRKAYEEDPDILMLFLVKLFDAGRRLWSRPRARKGFLVILLALAALKAATVGYRSLVYRGNGLSGEYYPNTEFKNPPTKKTDTEINFGWGYGSPLSDFPSDHFSVRWTGFLKAPQTGNYTLATLSDDGVRLWIDDILLVNDWGIHANAYNAAPIYLEAGNHRVKVEYFEGSGAAAMKLYWERPGHSKAVIDRQYLKPAE